MGGRDVDTHYWDDENLGYFLTHQNAEQLIVRSKTAHDNAVPAGNGTMLGNLARLYHLTGDDDYRQRAEDLIKAFSGEVERNFFPLATLLNNSELFYAGVQVVLIGDQDKSLADVVRDYDLPNLILVQSAGALTHNPAHPANGKGMVGNSATAYVCKNMSCSLPVTEADALKSLLT